MSFDLRQNLLLVRDASLTGKPLFYFYNAMGREMVLTGEVLREILERQKEGTLCVNTYWGFSSDPTLEVWSFDENNDLMLHHRVGKSCTTYLPYEMIAPFDAAFKPINGLFIEDSLRHIIRIHLRATCREEQKITWFADLPEPEMRSMLLSLGIGPLRVSREDKEGLIKLHDRWLEDFDDKHKYTHNAIGLDPEDKVPADYRPDRIRDITKHMMAPTKTQEMMDVALSDLLRQCRIRGDIPVPGSLFNRYQLTCYYATHLIFAPDADEKLRSLIDNPQFLVNFIYGWYPDYTWAMINEEKFEYQQSLVRAALISLKRHVLNEIETYQVVVDGMVKFADEFNPKAADETQEESADAKAVRDHMTAQSEEQLRKIIQSFKIAPTTKAQKMKHAELVEMCCEYFGEDMPEPEEEEDEDELEAEKEPKPMRKYPAVLNAATISYEPILEILVRTGVLRSREISFKNIKANSEETWQEVYNGKCSKLIERFKKAVEGRKKYLETLGASDLETLAYCLTRLKDGDLYPRDCAYLKELIKHALR